jgi:phosphoribosylaminoimidazolecarboxamide formyltransferase / IMP cyclohydrolase
MTIVEQEIFKEDLPVRRALITVYDKAGVVEFAKTLAEFDVTLISTGGTHTALAGAGLQVLQVSEVTGSPERFHGRVKTLDPFILGPVLLNRANPEDMEESRRYNMPPIEMVVCNFYPFHDVIANPNVTEQWASENEDIGGPNLIRAGAKNYGSVAAVSSPTQYAGLIRELKEKGGKISFDTRKQLRNEGLRVVSDYTREITDFFETRTENEKRRDTRY